MTNQISVNTEPFLKWPGGKRWISKKVVEIIKEHPFRRYYEPFLGGGAVFFELKPEKAVLADINKDLVETYTAVKNTHLKIISCLETYPATKAFYDVMRKTEFHEAHLRASRFLYLNRLAFGGMYRVNKNGQFNVPFGGGGRKVDILWSKGLLASASNALANASIFCDDFEETIAKAGDGDVIYCDPTYTVTHNNNGFIRYNEKVFSWDDQERLAASALRAVNRGARVIISNAAHESILHLYKPHKPVVLSRHSCISRNLNGRKKVEEYLFVLNSDKKK
jgi:DNA adenine methylase